MSNIGVRLRAERDRLGITQDDFAAGVGVGKRSLINYEKGERSPDAEFLAAAAILGVDVLFVLTGMRSQPAPPSESLAHDEAEWLRIYRNSTPEMRKVLKAAGEAASKPTKRGDKAA